MEGKLGSVSSNWLENENFLSNFFQIFPFFEFIAFNFFSIKTLIIFFGQIEKKSFTCIKWTKNLFKKENLSKGFFRNWL